MRKMHKNLANLNLDDLKKCVPEQLQTHSVTAVLLALGSNYQAEKYYGLAFNSLGGRIPMEWTKVAIHAVRHQLRARRRAQ